MNQSDQLSGQFDEFRRDFEKLRDQIGKMIVGHANVVQDTLVALIAGGHVLLEGVPGLGKTQLVRTLADCLHVDFQRIQFTPDLMPADLTGTNVVIESPQGRRQFDFQKGPVFANVLLADEINRATPKTQSALLEAMQEHSVTVAGTTHALPQPFFVMATQNPLEMEGTYPLPEAQLDRFFFKLLVHFPGAEEIEAILDRTTEPQSPHVESVCDGRRVLAMRQLSRQIRIADDVRQFGIGVVMATHPQQATAPAMTRQFVRYGASPRGAQAMILAAKINAILDQRYHVARDDLRSAAHAALRHRLILNFEAQAEGIEADNVIDKVLEAAEAASGAIA